MNVKAWTIAALLPLVIVAACNDDNNVVVPANTATVRFVNATGNSNLDFASGGVVATGNNDLGFGGSSSCVVVNTANPNIVLTNSVTGDTITGFTPSFRTGGNFTVVAFTDAAGNTQFATLDNTNTPSTGMAGLRLFNAASGAGNLVVLGNGTALGNGLSVPFGTAGTFMDVPVGSTALSFNTGPGTSPVLTDAGNMVFNAGQNTTLFVGPATTAGSTTLRTFSASGC